MKPEHSALIQDKLPGMMPKFYQVLRDNGLPDFLIKHLEIIHADDDPCNGRCTDEEECVQVLIGGRFQWACQPKTDEGDQDDVAEDKAIAMQ